MNVYCSISCRFSLSFICIGLFLGATSRVHAQEVAVSTLVDAPDAGAAPVHAVMRSYSVAPPIKKHRWVTLNNISIATLVAGEVVDSLGTHENMTHPKWICGFNPGGDGNYSSADGRTYDLNDIQHVLCGPGPNGQLANYAYDVTQNKIFTEGGWVAQYGLAGNRNYAGVEGWNLANDVAQFVLARCFSRKKGWPGEVGPAVNFSHGINHLVDGISNFRFVSQHRNANTWDLPSTIYPDPRWWGRQ